MTVAVYLCGWREEQRRGRTTFVPELSTPGESFTAIDLRPDRTVVDGLCLFARVGAAGARPSRAGGIALGSALLGAKGDAIGPVARRLIGNRLGWDLSAIEDMRMLVAEIVHIGPRLGKVNGGNLICTPTLTNRLETWLGGELIHDLPAVAGGAFTEPFTYSDSDLSTHSPWSDVYGTAKVVSNKCQPNFSGSFDVAWYGTASASADMYCQASFDTLNADSGAYNFLAVRIRCDSTAADTGIQWEAGWATSSSINQFNMIVFTAGSNSVIGSWGSSDQVTGDVMPARPFTAKVQGSGSSLSGYMGAQGPFNVTDSSHSTKTRSGLMVYSEGYVSSSDPRVKLDNWEAGPLTTTISPSTVAGVVDVPAPTVVAGATISPSTVAAIAAVPAPTVVAGTVVSAAVVAAVAAVDAPGITAAAVVSAAVVAAVADVAAPSVVAGTSIPAVEVAAVAAVDAPAVSAGATIPAVEVAAVAAVDAPTVTTGFVITPSSVDAIVGIDPPTVIAGAVIAPLEVVTAVTIDPPTIETGATISATEVAAIAAVAMPAVSAGATIPAVEVAGVVDVPAPTLIAGAVIAPAAVDTIVAIPLPGVDAGAVVLAVTVAGIVAVNVPLITGAGIVAPGGSITVLSIDEPTISPAFGEPAISASFGEPSISVTIA